MKAVTQELKRGFDTLYKKILNSSLSSAKEPGYADASTALKDREETGEEAAGQGGKSPRAATLSNHSHTHCTGEELRPQDISRKLQKPVNDPLCRGHVIFSL